MQNATEISLPHHQSVSFSNEYFPYYNRKINIDVNEILCSEINGSLARNKNYEIQTAGHKVLYRNTQGNTKYHTLCPTIPHIPCPRIKFTQAKMWKLMHNTYMLNTFTVLQYFCENG